MGSVQPGIYLDVDISETPSAVGSTLATYYEFPLRTDVAFTDLVVNRVGMYIYSPNVDTIAEIRDSSGNVTFTSDPPLVLNNPDSVLVTKWHIYEFTDAVITNTDTIRITTTTGVGYYVAKIDGLNTEGYLEGSNLGEILQQPTRFYQATEGGATQTHNYYPEGVYVVLSTVSNEDVFVNPFAPEPDPEPTQLPTQRRFPRQLPTTAGMRIQQERSIVTARRTRQLRHPTPKSQGHFNTLNTQLGRTTRL